MNKEYTFIAKAKTVAKDIIEVATNGVSVYNTIGENQFFDLEPEVVYEITIKKLDIDEDNT